MARTRFNPRRLMEMAVQVMRSSIREPRETENPVHWWEQSSENKAEL